MTAAPIRVPPLPFAWPRLEAVLLGFLRAETRRAGFERVVVGVSGGLDSAVVLRLASAALGPDRVLALCLPHRRSAPQSLEDAAAVIAQAGCAREVIDISPMIDAFEHSTGCIDRLRIGNKMARERMALLYDRALADHALVLGTSNKTELLLGYSTRWGDSASDLNPIGDLYKAQVRAIGRALGLPDTILAKPPSADLWEGQTDEAELGLGYAEADAVLWYLVDARGALARAPGETGVDAAVCQRISERLARTQFKRMLPPICKLQPRTVGTDHRYPRDWGT